MAIAPMTGPLAAEISADISDDSESEPAGPSDTLPSQRDNKSTESHEVAPHLLFGAFAERLQPKKPDELSTSAPAPHARDGRESLGGRKTPIRPVGTKTTADVAATNYEAFEAYEDSQEELPIQPEPTDRTPAVPRQTQTDNTAVVAGGQESFSRDCTSCHDAQRALSKRKSLNGWRTTIRRMSSKSGADIPSSDWEAIAAYLAAEANPGRTAGAQAVNGGAASGETSAGSEKQAEETTLSAFAVFSPLWRGGTTDSLQNPGFFPELWVGAAWQPQGALTARVTACISCHNEIVSRVEVVEAAIRLDLVKWFQCIDPNVQATIDAGRFIVPFGAFSAQVSPGAFRTVTPPLIFNMGQRVANTGVAVLPMPYTDEGANLHAALPVDHDLDLTLDAYLVNGLQGSSFGIDFLRSRDYVDNNSQPSAGGQVTLGNQYIRAGGSITGGQFNSPFAGFTPGLDYQIVGCDIVAHYEDIVRVQAEYARRDVDTFSGSFSSLQPIGNDRTSGYYVQGELRVYEKPRISLLARYDGQDHRTVFGDAAHVRRLTAGVNFALPDGSLLMINYERWWLAAPFPDVDVVGVRWAATF